MEEQNEVQTTENNKKSIWITISLIIVFTLLTGIIVNVISKTTYVKKIDNLNTKIIALENSIMEYKNNNQSPNSDVEKLKEQLELINYNLVIPISEYTREIINWNTYTNTGFSFEISYPNTFLLKENNDTKQKETGAIAEFLVFDGKARNLRGEDNPGYFPYLTISYWEDINDDYAKGGSWVGEREYENLEDFFTDDNSTIIKEAEIELSGIKAYEVTVGGYGANYGIMFEHNNGIYRIEFPFVQNPPEETIKKKLLSSFKLID